MRKGFIIIQIDGLSYEVLNKVINKGYAPFLRSLIEKKCFKVNKMYCGLPATTSRTQLGIMYGDNRDIPGHMWFEKRDSRFFITYSSNDAEHIEAKKSNGILNGGGSIGNLFSGGAKESCSLFAVGNEIQSLFRLFPRSRIWLHILLGLFILPFDLMISVVGKFRQGSLLGTIFAGVIFPEYETDLAIEEIKKRFPSLYVNFLGYDVASHNFGCESICSMWAIRIIDREIKKIYQVMKKDKSIDYDLFILSDHGQVGSIPFKDYFKETLKDVVKRALKDQEMEVMEGDELKYKLVLNQIEYIVSNISWLRMVRGLSRMVTRRYFKIVHPTVRKENVIVISSGDIAHIYFNMKKEKIVYEEIEKIYPNFLSTLLGHEGVGFLALFSSENGPVILEKNGRIVLLKKEKDLPKEDISFRTFDHNFLFDSVKEIVEMKNSGDVILFSTKIKGKAISFSSGVKSTHGGVEKDEQEMFIVSSPFCKYSVEEIKNPKELYPLFMKYRNQEKNCKNLSKRV